MSAGVYALTFSKGSHFLQFFRRFFFGATLVELQRKELSPLEFLKL
jgi:hypothetical protein